MDMPEKIESLLRAQLAASVVEIEDETRLHAGHVGAAGGGGHYRVVVVSDRFADLSLMQQHRLVYAALAGEMKTTIHALALRTYTPEQWQGR